MAYFRPPVLSENQMKCRVYAGTQLVPTIDLGQQPWCNHFLTVAGIGREIMFGDQIHLFGITSSLGNRFGVDLQKDYHMRNSSAIRPVHVHLSVENLL